MSLRLSRILHAGYLFESDGVRLLFDPLFENPFSRNCYAFPDVSFNLEELKKQKFDAVFISHYHDDHCSFESLNLIHRETPLYLFCAFEEMFDLIKDLGFKNVFPINLNSPVQKGPFQVTARRALDASVDSLFQIQVAGLNILNVVDSWIDEDVLALLLQQGPWDLLLWPFQTMREIEVLSPRRAGTAVQTLPPEWIEQIKNLKPKWIVPSSCQFQMEAWSWYNHFFFPITYKQFENEMRQILPESQVKKMNPSTSFDIDKSSIRQGPAVPWIDLVQKENVDYQYLPDFPIPTTSEISKYFKKLTKEQKDEVICYCRNGLPAQYPLLEISDEEFFHKTTTWCLSLFDDQGLATNFYYRLKGRSIAEISEPAEDFGWLTEIPMARLYGALVEGESLTSLYIRINDRAFSPEVEAKLKDVDLLEDPLIRCLFSREWGAYQKAQLSRIKSRNQA